MLHECLQKPDSAPGLHIILHVLAVFVPSSAALVSTIAPGVAVAVFAAMFLVLGGHGAKALGGNLGAFGVSLGLGALVFAASNLGLPLIALALFITATVAALAWLTERHQNGGHWCGQDIPNFHNRLKGAGIGGAASVLIAVLV